MLSNKPLVLTVSPQIDGKELESLRDAGVAIIALDGDRKEVLDALPALRKTIEALPPLRRRREERPEALVPRTELAAGPTPDEEEEEEDSW